MLHDSGQWLHFCGKRKTNYLRLTIIVQTKGHEQESESKADHEKGKKDKRKKGACQPQHKEAEAGGGLFSAARACGGFRLPPGSFRERIPVLLPDFPDEAVRGAEKLFVHLPEQRIPPGGRQHSPLYRFGRAAATSGRPGACVGDKQHGQVGQVQISLSPPHGGSGSYYGAGLADAV